MVGVNEVAQIRVPQYLLYRVLVFAASPAVLVDSTWIEEEKLESLTSQIGNG